MPNVALLIEYDGSGFHGWQYQPELRTIQGELVRVLETVLREKIEVLHASGRTDAGVHAKGQVINFVTSKEPDLRTLAYSISSILRGEVAVLGGCVMPDEFHSRRSANRKQYSYTILNRPCPAVLDKGRVWQVGVALDYERMVHEAKDLIGTHDFSSFRDAGCLADSAVKTIYESEISVEDDYVEYRVIGSGFLKQMVRIITGTLVDIGRGYIKQPISDILEAKNRALAGVTAPPQGLKLDWVGYREGLVPRFELAMNSSVDESSS